METLCLCEVKEKGRAQNLSRENSGGMIGQRKPVRMETGFWNEKRELLLLNRGGWLRFLRQPAARRKLRSRRQEGGGSAGAQCQYQLLVDWRLAETPV
jgi:hypothetical protein